MTLDDSVPAFRLRLMARAQALGNVSQASREFGISRSLFYRWRKRYLTYGPDGLHPRRTGARPGRPPTLSVQTERAILALAITWPTWGPLQLALQLRQPEHGRWQMAPSTVYRLLRRSGIQTRWERRVPHIQATKLGELVRSGHVLRR
jgi:transposase